MILRKPYAFIIKHFRLLHIIMAACLFFMIYTNYDIYRLFGTLQSTNTTIYAGAQAYINNNVYFAVLGIIAISSIIFWLFQVKKKPNMSYLILIGYCLLYMIGTAYLFSILHTIQTKVLELDSIILIKDLAFLTCLPGLIAFVFSLIRGIGFDIKKFNFSKDIEELKIVDQDSEEFEFVIGANNYKYMRSIRRALRETKYYILENKLAISIMLSVVGIVLIGFGIYNYQMYSKSVRESELITVNGISYVVKKSYITSEDFNGNKVKSGYKYVVLDMSFYNSMNSVSNLNFDLLTLVHGQLKYYPTLLKNGKFYDLGVPYSENMPIQPASYLEATLAFEVPSTLNTRNFTLRIQYSLDNSGSRDIIARYRNIAINAYKLDTDKTLFELNNNETINTNVAGVNEFGITIKDYAIKDSFDSKYVNCSSVDYCKTISSVVTPELTSHSTMLILSYDATLFDDANFTKTFNTYKKIFENFGYIRYKIYNKEYIVPAKVIGNGDLEGKMFLEVERNINSATEIYFEFHFRDNVYQVKLNSTSE